MRRSQGIGSRRGRKAHPCHPARRQTGWSPRQSAATRPRGNPQRAETSCCAAYCEAVFSTGGFRILCRIEQPMQMYDEITHLGVIDGRLRLRLPRRIGGRVVGIDADDVHLIEVLEDVVFEIGQLAADHEMKQLLLRGTVWHGGSFLTICPASR